MDFKSVSEVKDFIKKGGNPSDHNFALQHASGSGRLKVVKYLISIRSEFPSTNPAADNNRALEWASADGHLKVVKYLISRRREFPGIDPADHNNDAIVLASAYGHLKVVKYLISLRREFPRIDPATQSNHALRRASRNGHIEVVKCLLKWYTWDKLELLEAMELKLKSSMMISERIEELREHQKMIYNLIEVNTNADIVKKIMNVY